MIRKKILPIIGIGTFIFILLVGSMFKFGRKYEDVKYYNNIKLTIQSPKSQYKTGEVITIKVMAINNSDEKFLFDTRGSSIEDSITNFNLEEPRPAYDLIFIGSFVDDSLNIHPYNWSLADEIEKSNRTAIELQPNTEVELLNFEWDPPKAKLVTGVFRLRFADTEFGIGIGFEQPKR